jgi:hypothetical protein
MCFSDRETQNANFPKVNMHDFIWGKLNWRKTMTQSWILLCLIVTQLLHNHLKFHLAKSELGIFLFLWILQLFCEFPKCRIWVLCLLYFPNFFDTIPCHFFLSIAIGLGIVTQLSPHSMHLSFPFFPISLNICTEHLPCARHTLGPEDRVVSNEGCGCYPYGLVRKTDIKKHTETHVKLQLWQAPWWRGTWCHSNLE